MDQESKTFWLKPVRIATAYPWIKPRAVEWDALGDIGAEMLLIT